MSRQVSQERLREDLLHLGAYQCPLVLSRFRHGVQGRLWVPVHFLDVVLGVSRQGLLGPTDGLDFHHP